MVSAQGVSTDPVKIQAVVQWPVPTNLKQLRGFLGLTGYYRRFIQHYGTISKPLTQLLKKGVPFVWSSATDTAFQLLKQKLTQAPVLAVPDFNKQFTVETDASDLGIGAVLMQDQHPIAYLSQHLCPRNQALSVYEKECLAILLAIEKWKPYLQHKEFLIKTDHQSLLYLTEQRVSSKLQQKALMKLMGLRFKIAYKKGVHNSAADALSRYPLPDTICAVSSCIPSWMQKLQEGYMEDPQAQQLLTDLSVTKENEKGYKLQEGIIRYKGRVWVGNNKLAQQHILIAMHDSGMGGHSGITPTYIRIKQLFAWPGLKTSVTQFVQQCQVCQQAKSEHTKLPGLLQPLPVPDNAWEIVCMDFIEGLP